MADEFTDLRKARAPDDERMYVPSLGRDVPAHQSDEERLTSEADLLARIRDEGWQDTNQSECVMHDVYLDATGRERTGFELADELGLRVPEEIVSEALKQIL